MYVIVVVGYFGFGIGRSLITPSLAPRHTVGMYNVLFYFVVVPETERETGTGTEPRTEREWIASAALPVLPYG